MECKNKIFDCLAVSYVEVFPFQNVVKGLKALATIVLNDQLQIRGLRVIDGENGLFVGYPIDKNYNGEEYRTVCLPITRQLREHIEIVFIEKYNEVTA